MHLSVCAFAAAANQKRRHREAKRAHEEGRFCAGVDGPEEVCLSYWTIQHVRFSWKEERYRNATGTLCSALKRLCPVIPPFAGEESYYLLLRQEHTSYLFIHFRGYLIPFHSCSTVGFMWSCGGKGRQQQVAAGLQKVKRSTRFRRPERPTEMLQVSNSVNVLSSFSYDKS